ncbi:unnamed protein product [Pieris macdunnoughi]|uniref:Uncharacterized protein n=1 Tax=Pieris macdunnoughi TaxID=345717 RepID=A0A821MGS9_9NEOP|nr:unnamed protein product [Pieris macdunnoughi]
MIIVFEEFRFCSFDLPDPYKAAHGPRSSSEGSLLVVDGPTELQSGEVLLQLKARNWWEVGHDSKRWMRNPVSHIWGPRASGV